MSASRLWDCPIELSKKEKFICSKLKNSGKLFVFLREQRHRIFDEHMEQKLLKLYADHPAGKPPVPAALLAMASLLQCYEQKSDAAAALEAMFDVRWRMVLNCLSLDDETAPFSQGTLCDFRHRLVRHNMDEVLLEHTVAIARDFGGFGHTQLRIALDSAPLQGAGRVEDTFNLIGHALELLVSCAARIRMTTEAQILTEAGTQLIGKSSVKAALDIDWSVAAEKQNAINTLLKDVSQLQQWLSTQPSTVTEHKELKACLTLLETVLSQNIEPDPDGGSRITQGVAEDRLISIHDDSMRHGRKSSSRTINGFKQHIAVDMDTKLILATCVRPANEPEHKAAEWLKPKVLRAGEVKELSIDRGYLAALWTAELDKQGHRVIAKPWTSTNKGKFSKKAFEIDFINRRATCPAGHSASFSRAKPTQIRFGKERCQSCILQGQCTDSKTGKTLTLHANEEMLQGLREFVETPQGRAQARERTKVEHALASICNRKKHRARYVGIRLNEYDLNRTAAITNLHIGMAMAA